MKNLNAFIQWAKHDLVDHFYRYRSIYLILLLYITLTTLYYYYFIHNWDQTKKKFYDPEFAMSFSASLAEDLIFFLAISIAVIILTNKPIYSYSFAEKISAIINSKNAKGKEGVNTFLQSTINDLLAYNKVFSIYVTVTDYDATENAYKTFVELTYRISNICNDKDYRLEEYSEFYVSKSDIAVKGEWGNVILFNLKDLNTNLVVPFVDEKKPFVLDKKFKHSIDIGLHRNQEKEVRLNFFTWSKTGDDADVDLLNVWNAYSSNRYAEETILTIENRLTTPLKYQTYSYKKRLKSNKGLTLRGNSVLLPGKITEPPLHLYGELYPLDDVRVFFFKQEENV